MNNLKSWKFGVRLNFIISVVPGVSTDPTGAHGNIARLRSGGIG